MTKFDIWIEGYACTGNQQVATLYGTGDGETFEEAAREFGDLMWPDDNYWRPDELTYWACRLFSNEEDARRSFG